MTEFDSEFAETEEPPVEAREIAPRQPAAPAPAHPEGSRWFAYIAVGLTVVALLVGLAAVVGVIYVLARLR